MILAIDAGNSFVKWGYHDGHAWIKQSRASLLAFCTAPLRYLDENPSKVVASNVAGAVFQDALNRALPGSEIHWMSAQPSACGVSNRYDQPTQLGSDRWAALIAANARAALPCAVVSVGTAVTVDLLAAGGVFAGGVIAPGPQLMRDALTHGTEAIKQLNGKVLPLPANTADAVETGVMRAVIGAIEQTANIFETAQGTPVSCLLTGGAANLIAPFLNRSCQVVDNLVLEGLLILSREEMAK